jgi:hypothetical protein
VWAVGEGSENRRNQQLLLLQIRAFGGVAERMMCVFGVCDDDARYCCR